MEPNYIYEEKKEVVAKKMLDNLYESFNTEGEDSYLLKKAIASEIDLNNLNDDNAIITLGVTQSGKSSTFNFLFGCKPFIEMGYIYKESFILLKQNSMYNQYLDKNDSKRQIYSKFYYWRKV